jgi:hypothetical protein
VTMTTEQRDIAAEIAQTSVFSFWQVVTLMDMTNWDVDLVKQAMGLGNFAIAGACIQCVLDGRRKKFAQAPSFAYSGRQGIRGRQCELKSLGT